MIGRTLSHFRITAELGEGGMGEVYRAEDTKLGRDVALKVLPEALNEDQERLARFAREAKVLAALNHSSIAAVHSFDHEESLHFLVMELAEGEDLAQRIARGPIPLADALPIALQIVEGLEFAHDKGIVHRDLKPANIMLGPDGTVKILDFGLAKAFETGSPQSESQLSESPTLTAQMTQLGVVLGTAGYMSPEQARGSEVDKRADIWAFGAVLFEMLAGRRLFDGDSVTDVLAAVMRADLELERLPEDVPPVIHRLLDRCLDRNEKTRLRDIGEARVRIAEVLADPEGGGSGDAGDTEGAGSTGWARTARLLPWLVAAAGIGVSVLLGGLYFSRTEAKLSAEVVHTSIRLPDGVRLAGWSSPAVALSPDERTIAFVGHSDGRQQLYLRRLDQPEAVAVPESDGAEGPFFSPDGRWVAFGAGAISGRSNEPRLLKRAPVEGGSTQPLAPLDDYVGGSWGMDGYIYYSDGFFKNSLRRIPAAGGEPEELSGDEWADELEETVVGWPQHFNDGRYLLFTAFRTRGGAAMVLDLGSGELRDLDLPADFSRYAPGGHLVFAGADAVLRAVPFDSEALEKRGAPIALVRDIAFTCNESAVFAVGGFGSALYATGFVRGSNRVLSRLVRIDPADGSIERLPFESDAFLGGVSLAPGGKRLAAVTWEGAVWIYDLSRGTRLKLPDGDVEGRRRFPSWSPDGTTIAFSVEGPDQGGMYVYTMAADGTGPARLQARRPGENYVSGWTPDSRKLIIFNSTGISRVPLSGAGEIEKFQSTVAGTHGVVSPDGRWLAFQSSETGRNEVYLAPYPDGGAVIPVSSNGGTRPEWSATGDALYFNSGCDFFRVDVEPGPDLELGRTQRLFEHCDPINRRGTAFEVDREGYFYMLEAVPESGVVTSLEFVQRWTEAVDATFGD